MQRIFVSFLFILTSLPAWSDFGRNDCQNFDYSKRFGPVRDQDGHGYCWAFVASALAEEAFCKKNRENCGKSVSPLDISRCQWALATRKEGGVFQDALECGISQGVCNEGHAPYDAIRSWGCTMKQLIVFRSNRCDRDVLKNFYTKWHAEKNKCEQDGVMSSQEQRNLSAIQAKLIEDLKDKVPEKILQGRNLRSLFRSSQSADEFLRRTLIGKSCEEHRARIPGKLVDNWNSHKEYSPRAIREALLGIREGLRKGSSVGIGVDLGRTKLNLALGGLVTQYEKNSNHGLIVTGMRWNATASRCEVNLRNSWGVGADFHGWTALRDIEGGLKYASYLQ